MSNNITYFLREDPDLIFSDIIRTTIEDYSKEIDSRIIVVSKDYVVKGDSNLAYLGYTFKHNEIKQALKGISNFGVYNFEAYGHVLYTSVPIIQQGEIIGAILISTSIEGIYDTVSQLNNKIIIVSFISIFIIALVSFVFAGILSDPIEKFTKIITKISQGNFEEKVEINTNDEFMKMGNAFNIMVRKLDQVDKQRKDFVANVSHELRTPLSSIKLLSESLLHQEEGNMEIYKEFLGDISSEVDRLNNIINDLLTLVDLDKEKLTLKYKTTYINFLLEKIVSRLIPLAKEKSIDLELITKDQIQIEVDSEKIQQSIINIIHNAIKYTPEHGSVTVTLYKEGNYAVIKIQDNGIGIDSDSLEHIFNRFYRVDKARARKTGGTGLGLSISHQIVTLHQGNIEVESTEGVGSTFYIKIPKDLNKG